MRARLSFCIALLAGCGSKADSSDVAVDVSGTQGQPIAATNVSDILVVDLSVNGVHGTAVVDTGSPIVALDPSAFVNASLPNGSGTVSALTLGALTFANPSVVGGNLLTSPDPTIPIDGSLGCGILCAFALSLDYRGSAVTLGTSTAPANIAIPGGSVAFTLEGGGTATLTDVPGSVVFPVSRIPVTATLEGHAYSFIVDTGSSFVVLRESIFTSLVADGRAQITDVGTSTVGQESSSAVTRLRSLSIGGQEVTGIVGAEDPDIEEGLDSIATEVGHDVDGLVGGSFLRHFYVTIDYPAGALHLQSYVQGGPTFDAFDRIGVAVDPASDGALATVTQVFASTDAATQGVLVGDVIVSIDGQSLATLGSTALDGLLAGPVGSTKTVTFGKASSTALSMKTVTMAVNDILPL